MTSTNKPIVILGGGGKTGGRLAERLEKLGRNYRLASRSTTPAFDWENAGAWGEAIDGAGALYVTYYPDIGLPGGAEAVGELARLAASKGIQRVVLLSGRGEEAAQRGEANVQAAVQDWTILRASWFNQNFSESFLLDGVMTGELALPAGEIPEPFVDAEDIADVAVAVLTQPGHERQVYELTGPESLRFVEVADILSDHLKRNIRFVPVPLEPFLAELASMPLPDYVVPLMRMLFADVLDGRNAVVQDGVARVLGRAPRSFQEYVARTAETGVWDTGA
ncbi:NmrA family transcriptional regulator [Lacibacterium aquatile]|uniref:NmrA family transcriptional regulator n=1 Tax=Lacibacterium aquatile TaxID=1168082 RepID=A0ABW5DKT1_9PROT